MNKSKIGVFTWYDSKYKNFGDIFYQINKKYCDLNNYDYIKCNKKRVEYICIKNCFGYCFTKHWERYALLESYLDKGYDYLVWIDSDAHFYINSPPLENFIEHNKDKTFILSGDYDRYDNDYINNITRGIINSGFFIVKNNDKAKYFLKEIYTNLDWLEKKSNRWHDQATIRYIYDNNIDNFKNISTIIPYPTFMSFPKCETFYQPLSSKVFIEYIKNNHFKLYNLNKPMTLHYVGGSCESRVKGAQKYLDLLNSSYPNFPPEDEEYLSIQ